jgi:hypothetical protein
MVSWDYSGAPIVTETKRIIAHDNMHGEKEHTDKGNRCSWIVCAG